MAAEEKVKRIHRLPPCHAHDLERLESWLADMVKEGLRLQKISRLGLFVFTQDTPRNVRYRLEAAQSRLDDRPPQDMLDLTREYGWDYVDKYGAFFIFQSINPDSPELNTDPSIQALTLRALKKRCRISQLFLIVYLTVFFLVLVPGFFYHMATYGSVLLISLCLFMVLDFIERSVALFSVSRLHRRLASGSGISHDKNWRKLSGFHHAHRIISIGLAALFLCCWAQEKLTIAKPLSEYTGTPPFVTLEELSPDDQNVSINKISNGRYETLSDPLIPVNIQWLDGGNVTYPGHSSTAGLLQLHYCETISPWLARSIAEDYLDYFSFQYESDAVGLDLAVEYAAAFYDRFGMARVVLAEDTTVVCAIFSMSDAFGNFTLENWAALMADMLT